MFPPAAKLYDMMLLDSLVLENKSLPIDPSFRMFKHLRYGSLSNYVAVKRPAGLTTNILSRSCLASEETYNSSGNWYAPFEIYL